MILLEAATLCRVLKCYNFNKGIIDTHNSSDLKDIAEKMYSSDFLYILNIMLEFNP